MEIPEVGGLHHRYARVVQHCQVLTTTVRASQVQLCLPTSVLLVNPV
jgi:hypothetical protein